MVEIIKAFPPNIAAIKSRFALSGREIFGWGDIIYNPAGYEISKALIAHEGVHCRQQGHDIEGWWSRYLDDAEFRFAQELEAHHEELRVFCLTAENRMERRRMLSIIAHRLASKMYGNMVSKSDARRWLKVRAA